MLKIRKFLAAVTETWVQTDTQTHMRLTSRCPTGDHDRTTGELKKGAHYVFVPRIKSSNHDVDNKEAILAQILKIPL